MINFNRLLKYFYNLLITIIKKILFLNNFSNYEKKGKISELTKLKIIPKTSVILPFELGRTIRGLSFKKNIKKDPFGLFVIKMNKGLNKKDLLKFLFSQYKKEKYLNAGNVVSLKDNLHLSRYPAWALTMPWDEINIEDRFSNYPNTFFKNRLKHELNLRKLKDKKNTNFFYSLENALSQFYQTKTLLKNIKKYGIKNSRPLPKVNILIDGTNWRWFMTDEGNHRAYIFSINGSINFHCEVSKIIYKKNVSSWHNVKNGLYSHKEALLIFNHFFSGNKCLRGLV